MTSSILLHKGRAPAFSDYGKDAKQQFLLWLHDLFENAHLYPHGFEFTQEWFESVEKIAFEILNAQKLGHPRTGRPLRADVAKSQKRIAEAIVDRVQMAKTAIASAIRRKNSRVIIESVAGQLVWIGSNGEGGRGIRVHKHRAKVDFAISIKPAWKGRGLIRVWQGATGIYEFSERVSQLPIGTSIKLKGNAGTVTFYDGNENQEPPRLIETLTGGGNTSAYRGQFLAVFQNFDVTESRQIPEFLFDSVTEDSDDRFVANQHGAEIIQLFSKMRSEPDRILGQGLALAQSKGGKTKASLGEPIHAVFRAAAEELFKRHPRSKSVRWAAREIAKRFPGAKEETIRKVIRKRTD